MQVWHVIELLVLVLLLFAKTKQSAYHFYPMFLRIYARKNAKPVSLPLMFWVGLLSTSMFCSNIGSWSVSNEERKNVLPVPSLWQHVHIRLREKRTAKVTLWVSQSPNTLANEAAIPIVKNLSPPCQDEHYQAKLCQRVGRQKGAPSTAR